MTAQERLRGLLKTTDVFQPSPIRTKLLATAVTLDRRPARIFERDDDFAIVRTDDERTDLTVAWEAVERVVSTTGCFYTSIQEARNAQRARVRGL